MWQCPGCGEQMEDTFDACWRCGMGSDGTAATDFHAQSDDPEASAPDPEAENTGAADGEGLTRLEIAELVCKAVALWPLASGIISLSALVLMLFTLLLCDRNSGHSLVGVAFGGIVPLGEFLAAALLWKMSGFIARRMVRDIPVPVLRTGLTSGQLMVIAFTTVGIYALFSGVKELLRIAAQVFFMCRENGINYSEFLKDINWQANFWGTLLNCGVAIWLVLGSRGIVQMIRRVRHGSVKASDEDQGNICHKVPPEAAAE